MGKKFLGMSKIFSGLQQHLGQAQAALGDVQRRVTQQALEATGLAEKTEEDDAPELVEHYKLEAFLKKLYQRTDKYMRAMNDACEMSYALAEEFVDAFADEEGMCGAAAQVAVPSPCPHPRPLPLPRPRPLSKPRLKFTLR